MRVLILILLLWSFSESVAAQANKPALRVSVEELDAKSAAECGIDRSSLQSIAVLTLRNNGIAITDQRSAPYLYLNLNLLSSLGSINICVMSLRISVKGYLGPDAIGRFRSRNGADTVLCSSGSLSTRNRSEARSYIFSNIEEHIKLCLGELEYN